MDRYLKVAVITAVVLGVGLAATGFAAGSGEGSGSGSAVMVNRLRFSPAIAGQLVKPQPLFAIPFGDGDAAVAGPEQDANRVTEGVPYAFLPAKDGSVWVLDTAHRKLKRFGADGKALAAVTLPAGVGDKPAIYRDFAPAGHGFWVISVHEGKVLQIDGKGQTVVDIEGLHDAWAIAADGKGNVLVNVPVMQAVLRFDDKGVLLDRYDALEDLSVVTDAAGAPYWSRMEEQKVTLLKVTAASPTATVELAQFPLDLPASAKAHYVSGKVLGTDAKGQVYLELVATDDDGVIHRQRVVRLSPTGETLGVAEILPEPFLAPDLPRHLTVMSDGRLLTFGADDTHYRLYTYTIP